MLAVDRVVAGADPVGLEDAGLEAAAPAMDQAEDVLLNQETGAVPLVFYTGSQVFRDSVKAYPSTPLGIMLWEQVEV